MQAFLYNMVLLSCVHTHTQALFLHSCCMPGDNNRPQNTGQPIAQLDGPSESSLCVCERASMGHDDPMDAVDPTSAAVDLPVDPRSAVENMSRPAKQRASDDGDVEPEVDGKWVALQERGVQLDAQLQRGNH